MHGHADKHWWWLISCSACNAQSVQQKYVSLYIGWWMIFSATLPVTIWQLSCQSKASVLGNLPSNVQRLVRIFFCWEPSHLLFGPCLNRSATKLPSKAYVFGNLPWTVRQLRVARQMSLKSNPWCSASPPSTVRPIPASTVRQLRVARQTCARQPYPLNRSATESCQTNEPEIQPLVFGKPPLHCSAHPCLNCSATESCQTNMCSATLPPEPSGNWELPDKWARNPTLGVRQAPPPLFGASLPQLFGNWELPDKHVLGNPTPWTVRQLRVARQMSLKSNPWCSASPLSIVLHVQFGSLGSSSHEPVTTVAKQMGMSRPILTIRLATESCQAHGACWALAGGGSR